MQKIIDQDLLFELEDLVDKISELSRQKLMLSLMLNEKAMDASSKNYYKLTIYTNLNEKLEIELAHYIQVLSGMYSKVV